MTTIIPSLLVTDEMTFKKQIAAIKDAVDMIQIDLCDGVFVPNTTWTYTHPKEAKDIIDRDFELHLMVADPLSVIADWQDHPRLQRILFHYESAKDEAAVTSIIETLRNGLPHIATGIVLNPPTSTTVLASHLDSLSAVMLMGVHPGFQGQAFIPETIDRIKTIKAMRPSLFVEVDGGVNEQTLPDIVRAGADAVCPGSAVFGNANTPTDNIHHLYRIISSVH